MVDEELDVVTDSIDIKMSAGDAEKRYRDAKGKVKSHVAIDNPRWRKLSDAEYQLRHQFDSEFLLIRLGCQFYELPKDMVVERAKVQAFLEADSPNELALPRVAEVFPVDLFDGTTQQGKIKFAPSLKFSGAELGIGEVELQTNIGQVTPEIIGYLGDDERSPYWILRPRSRPLQSVQHFWLVVERPIKCKSMRLFMFAELVLQTKKWGLIPIGPQFRDRQTRRSIEIW